MKVGKEGLTGTAALLVRSFLSKEKRPILGEGVFFFGGSEVPDLKLNPEELFADLELLYNRMVALGVTMRDGEVYLEDLDGKL